jgi:hydroxymethylglutaryl-CoA lyase
VSRLVRITDVSPRDGLQNESAVIPSADKVRLIAALCRARVDEVEVSSFVSPKWVPQLADAVDVFRASAGVKPSSMVYSALVPNDKGLESFVALNRAHPGLIDKLCLFTAASESFSRRNTNASIAESIGRWSLILRTSVEQRLHLKIYISCAFGCPFEGAIAPDHVAGTARTCLDAVEHVAAASPSSLASLELSLGDTIGVATPDSIRAVLERVTPLLAPRSGIPAPVLNLHLHDTFGHAASCVRAALALGVRSFDASVAGLGGCPYASTPGKPAPGNIATELLLRTIVSEGYTSRVDADALAGAAAIAREIITRARAASVTP